MIRSILLATVLACAVAPGCGGGGATVEQSTNTTGQELIDLQKALDSGAITEKEYEKEKKKILKRK